MDEQQQRQDHGNYILGLLRHLPHYHGLKPQFHVTLISVSSVSIVQKRQRHRQREYFRVAEAQRSDEQGGHAAVTSPEP